MQIKLHTILCVDKILSFSPFNPNQGKPNLSQKQNNYLAPELWICQSQKERERGDTIRIGFEVLTKNSGAVKTPFSRSCGTDT
ncbi:hypothetical protein CEXT_540611 [Caerostris extrusa]|uniref:Uncharacterized protein n=1 Tax=Caerostris extrusa TaxID=172846 RepID=A0AAV4NDK3_CAEEX|nr:hypothetical protein CEXT_540611 [Caerostris extrusa]